MSRRQRAFSLFFVLTALLLTVVFYSLAVAQEKAPADSWITPAGSAVGSPVIVTDCRQSARYDESTGNPRGRGGIGIQKTLQPGAIQAPMPAKMAESAAIPQQDSQVKSPQCQDAPTPQTTGSVIYLSNDDSMSLSSAQRIEYAIDNMLPIPVNHLRPHEFLNYYRFDGRLPKGDYVFAVQPQLTEGLLRNQTTLSLSVRGKTLTKEERRPAIISFVLDQSGSMASSNKMDYLKKGMKQVYDQFKTGDVVNLVQFNHEICSPLKGFVVGRDKRELYEQAIERLESWGSTNLHDGLNQGYKLAENYLEKSKNNRVVMITDALANTGVTNEDLTATVTKYYDKRHIALSGIGVGHDFNDRMLNTLTERGKGAYLFLSSENAVSRVFGDKFISLLEVVARDVHFKLTLPESLKMDIFYGEESSEKKEKVQAIHYFANSAQLFLMDLKGEPASRDEIGLDIEYFDPKSGEAKTENFKWKISQMQSDSALTVRKARLILTFTDLLAQTSPATYRNWPCWTMPCYRLISPPPPMPRPPHPTPVPVWGVDTSYAQKACVHYRSKMEELAKALSGDNEVNHLMDLQERYCSRFDTETPSPDPSNE